jgi:hypothetical protein
MDHAKKNVRKPWQKKPGVMPPHAHAACVGAMEDGLDVYPRPDDPQRPVGCLEEARTPLGAETRVPMPAAAGKLARSDDAYERNGTATLCMVLAPLAGQRRRTVTDRRPAIDVAQGSREVGDVPYPQADTLVLVLDKLHTHTPAAWSQAFALAEAHRLLARLEMHPPPQHGRWRNMADTALRVLATQGLDRRMPDKEPLTREVAAWERRRNAAECRIAWQCTTHNARIKLKRLYPSIELG